MNTCEMCQSVHSGIPQRPICHSGQLRCYTNPREYTRDHPEGAWAVERAHRLIPGYTLLFPGSGMHTGLPGGYLHATLMPDFRVVICDRDDGFIEKPHTSLEDARATMEELKQLSPCTQGELVDLGIGFIWW